MEFNSEKFVSEMTKVGMQKEQADLLAQACANFFSNPAVTRFVLQFKLGSG